MQSLRQHQRAIRVRCPLTLARAVIRPHPPPVRHVTIARAAVLAAGLAACVLSACQRDETVIETLRAGRTDTAASIESIGAERLALVRIINVVNGPSTARVRFDGLALFDSVVAGTVSEYRNAPRSRGRFTARRTAFGDSLSALDRSDTTALQSAELTLLRGARYSVLLRSSDLATRSLLVLHETVVPDSGMARLRVIHAASGAPALDIRAVNGTEMLFSALTPDDDDEARDVYPATVTLEVRAHDRSRVLLTLAPVTLAPGTVTTIVLHGAATLTALVFSDRELTSR